MQSGYLLGIEIASNLFQSQLLLQSSALTIFQEMDWPIADWTKFLRPQIAGGHQNTSVGCPCNRNKINVQVHPKGPAWEGTHGSTVSQWRICSLMQQLMLPADWVSGGDSQGLSDGRMPTFSQCQNA